MNASDIEFFKSIGVNFYENDVLSNMYVTFCCEQALLIAESLRTKENIKKFSNTNLNDRKKMVPNISNEHDPNTFLRACKLAIHYIPMLRDKRIDDILS